MRDPMKPRNLTDIPNPTFGAMVRALARGEAATLGEAYERLEAKMNESRPDLTTRLVDALRAVRDRLAERFGSEATNNLDADVIGPADALLEEAAARAAIDARRQRATKAAPDYDGECCALCKCNHGSPIRTLTEEHCICRDDGHRWVSRKVAAPPAGETAPDPGLDTCPVCVRKSGEVNHPRGMVFVGWGIGWQTCNACGGTTRAGRNAGETAPGGER